MPDIVKAILGPNARRRKPEPPPVQTRRAPEPAKAAPAAAHAGAEREAVRQRWQNPPTPVVPAQTDVAERLGILDLDQLHQVAGSLGFVSYQDDDEHDLRRRIVAYIDEWSGDAADDAALDGTDPEAAREDGRKEAVGFIEEGMFNALVDTTPPSQWRDAMGVPEARMQELASHAVNAGALPAYGEPGEEAQGGD